MNNKESEIVSITIPKEILEKLDIVAEKNMRSRSGEIAFRLEESLRGELHV